MENNKENIMPHSTIVAIIMYKRLITSIKKRLRFITHGRDQMDNEELNAIREFATLLEQLNNITEWNNVDLATRSYTPPLENDF